MKKILFIALLGLSIFSCRKEEDILKHANVSSHNRLVTDSTAINYFLRCDSVGASTDSLNKQLINNLLIRLKNETGNDGITSQFNSLDVLYLFPEHKSVAGYNILQNKYNATIMTDYAASHTYLKGFKGNGTTFKMDSHFNPFDGIGTYKFKNNDNSFGCYINTNTREVKGLLSNMDASQNGYELRTHPLCCVSYNGNATGMTSLAVDNTGMFVSRRTPDNHTNAWKNCKTSVVDNISTVTATVNKSFKMFTRDIGGTYTLYSLNRLAYVFYGNSNVNLDKLNDAIIEEYLKPIGAALTKRVVFDGNSFFSQQTMPAKVMDLLWANGIQCTSHFNAVYGIPITTMITNAPTKVDAYQKTYYDKQIFLFWELTNSMKGTSANVNTTFNNLKTYFDARHSAGWNCDIVCGVCPPFASDLSTGINPSKRDNESDLLDTTRINGKIRWGKSVLGIQYVSDEGSGSPINYDPVYKDALGVAGIGEKNTTYFAPDGHMTTVGYNYWATNHLYPQCYTVLH